MPPHPPTMAHPDTEPGFTLRNQGFFLKFVTGMQCGVSSRLLEYETDWYEVMQILLAKLEEEPEVQNRFEAAASLALEDWAKLQPGGASLNLKIRVALEEKKYFMGGAGRPGAGAPPGARKSLKLTFNDRFTTQVLFHVRKKSVMRSLKYLSAIAAAAPMVAAEAAELLAASGELPAALAADVRAGWSNCWTERHFRAGLPRCTSEGCICRAERSDAIQKANPKAEDVKAGPSKPLTASERFYARGKLIRERELKAETKTQRLKRLASLKEAPKEKLNYSYETRSAAAAAERFYERGKKIKEKRGQKQLNDLNDYISGTVKKGKEKDATHNKTNGNKKAMQDEKNEDYQKLQQKYKDLEHKFNSFKKDQAKKSAIQANKYKKLEEKMKALVKKKDTSGADEVEKVDMSTIKDLLPAPMYKKLEEKLKAHKQTGKSLADKNKALVGSNIQNSSQAKPKAEAVNNKCGKCPKIFANQNNLTKHRKFDCSKKKIMKPRMQG